MDHMECCGFNLGRRHVRTDLNCPAEDSLLDISLEEGMDRMDLDELHREQSKRARSINPSISDLRLAVDAAAEMQVSVSCCVTYLACCLYQLWQMATDSVGCALVSPHSIMLTWTSTKSRASMHPQSSRLIFAWQWMLL